MQRETNEERKKGSAYAIHFDLRHTNQRACSHAAQCIPCNRRETFSSPSEDNGLNRQTRRSTHNEALKQTIDPQISTTNFQSSRPMQPFISEMIPQTLRLFTSAEGERKIRHENVTVCLVLHALPFPSSVSLPSHLPSFNAPIATFLVFCSLPHPLHLFLFPTIIQTLH